MDRSVLSIITLKTYFNDMFGYHMPSDILCEIINKITDDLQFSTGGNHLFVLKNRKLYACGDNKYGQLGLGDFETRNNFCEVSVKNIVKVSCGNYHSIILSRNGYVYSTGNALYGALGLGQYENLNEFRQVKIPEPIYDIACNDHSTFALSRSGTLYSWGKNSSGQLGLCDYENRYQPCKVNIDNVEKIFCGRHHMFVLTRHNNLFSTGYNDDGQLGLNHTYKVNSSRRIFLNDVVDISCDDDHSVILTKSGKLLGSGSNRFSQLGNRETDHLHFKELNIDKLGDIAKIRCCNKATIIVTKQGKISVWPNYKYLNNHIYDINIIKNQTQVLDIYDKSKYTIFTTQNGKLYIKGELGDNFYREFTEMPI